MAVFILTHDDLNRLREAKRLALENQAPLDVVERFAGLAKTNTQGVLRGPRPDDAPLPEQVELSRGWRVAISCEQQPVGPCLHLSISSPTPAKTLARPEAIRMVLEALGCGNPIHGWLEDYEEDGVVAGTAVNVLTLLS